MYKIMIVDDEPYIVSGLQDLCADMQEYELDVFCAYSADEAVARLQATRMDILITDIQMPGMSGLELAQKVREWWPRTKIIFLTGYNQFDYVQSALRSEAVDFLLKTEDESKIVAAIRRAIRKCNEDSEETRLVEGVKQRLRAALPVLQKDLLLRLAQGETLSADSRTQKFKELDIPLDADADCLLAIGRVDEWKHAAGPYDRSLLLYGIQNIAEEFLSPAVRFQAVIGDAGDFIWLMQPGSAAGGGEEADTVGGGDSWGRCVSFVHGTIDAIQSACRSLLKQPISIAAGSSPAPWTSVAAKVREFSLLLAEGLGTGGEMLVLENADARASRDAAAELAGQQLLSAPGQAEMMDRLLESGKQEEFRKLVLEAFAGIPAGRGDMRKETYYAVALRLYACVNRLRRRKEEGELPARFDLLFHYERHAGEAAAVWYLLDAAAVLFDQRHDDQEERTNELVLRLHAYIEQHLSGDVSLTRLGEVVSLNPSYLCRLYKQITGSILTDFIAETKIGKAKELLVNSAQLRITDISKAVGFDSPAYFSRFFKKYTRMTPQEYRDRY
ncbi:response regulator transcription factor [Paenibacillus silvisoli]|uniref:response regulator transcription factor n=1 Tax=Paenibacillus silvisoli TaxID=3110539 RepID=UPI002803A0C9|nr:response regulator [Paenibacillus silvisoli]